MVTPITRVGWIGAAVAVGRGGRDVAVAGRGGACVGAGGGGGGGGGCVGARRSGAVVAVGAASVAVAAPFVGVTVAGSGWLDVAVSSGIGAGVSVGGGSVGRAVAVAAGVGVRVAGALGLEPRVAAMMCIDVAKRNSNTAMMKAAAAVLLRLSYQPQPWWTTPGSLSEGRTMPFRRRHRPARWWSVLHQRRMPLIEWAIRRSQQRAAGRPLWHWPRSGAHGWAGRRLALARA
jgi:hypothetical protein